jgi:ribonuclease G
MSREIISSIDAAETRVAVMQDGTLVNLFVERSEPVAGNIYKGRVNNVLPGMDAAFVDIGLERNAFLHVADIRSQRLDGEEVEESFGKGAIAERLRVGQEILVQVTKEPMGTKGARVTTYVALPAHYLVLMPTVSYIGVSRRITADAERRRLRQIAERIRPEGMGIIVRTAAEGVEEQVLADDVAFLRQMWNRVLERARSWWRSIPRWPRRSSVTARAGCARWRRPIASDSGSADATACTLSASTSRNLTAPRSSKPHPLAAGARSSGWTASRAKC